jgi:hypothetical protein
VQPHLPTLNERFRLPYIGELIERKRAAETGGLAALDWGFHAAELDRLEAALNAAFEASTLPLTGPLDELHEWLVAERLR